MKTRALTEGDTCCDTHGTPLPTQLPLLGAFGHPCHGHTLPWQTVKLHSFPMHFMDSWTSFGGAIAGSASHPQTEPARP